MYCTTIMHLYLRVVNFLLLLQNLQVITEARYVNESTSLELVIKVTRHGERTPVYYPPGDPNNNFWKESEGELTNEGKVTLYEIGKSFRSEYKDLLSEFYKPEEIVTLSTDIDRTIMSAQSFLAGLYPPKGYQVWNKKIDWQPVPVHILFYDLDSLFANLTKTMLAVCPVGTQGDLFYSQYKDLIELIETATGTNYTRCYDINFYALLDTFTTEKFYGRTLPFNLDSRYEEINSMKNDFMVRIFGVPEVTCELDGPLFRDIGILLQAKRVNVLSQSAIPIFMSDYNILGFLAALTVDYPLTSPAFAASIIIELIKTTIDSQDRFNVKVYHIPTPEAPRQILQIKGCGHACSLDDFTEQLRNASIPQTISVCPCDQN